MRQVSIVLLVSRAVLICQYGSIMLWVKGHKQIITPLMIHIAAFAIGAVICLGFFFTFTSTASGQAYIVWYVIIVMEALAVFISSSQWGAVSFAHTNLNERCGLLTLIILGEGIIVLTKSVNYVTKGQKFTSGIIAQIISATFIIVGHPSLTSASAHQPPLKPIFTADPSNDSIPSTCSTSIRPRALLRRSYSTTSGRSPTFPFISLLSS